MTGVRTDPPWEFRSLVGLSQAAMRASTSLSQDCSYDAFTRPSHRYTFDAGMIQAEEALQVGMGIDDFTDLFLAELKKYRAAGVEKPLKIEVLNDHGARVVAFTW